MSRQEIDKKIEKAIQEAREERGALSGEEKKEIAKQIRKEERKRKWKVFLSAIGLSGVAILGGDKLLNAPQGDIDSYKTEYETFTNDEKEGRKSFQEQLREGVQIQEISQEPRDRVQEIKEMQKEQDVNDFLIDHWVENYENTTGDTTLKTSDIGEVDKEYQDYVYVDQATGQWITHGLTPDITKQKLIDAGISFEEKHDVDVYVVRGINERIMDCATLEKGQFVKVIPGDQYGEPYISVFEKMQDSIISLGIDYADYIERGDELSMGITKDRLIEAVKQQEMSKETQNLTAQKESQDREY